MIKYAAQSDIHGTVTDTLVNSNDDSLVIPVIEVSALKAILHGLELDCPDGLGGYRMAINDLRERLQLEGCHD